VMFHCIASIVGAGAMVHPFHSRSRIGWFQQDGRRICTARKIECACNSRLATA
jgi:hypothetical protein